MPHEDGFSAAFQAALEQLQGPASRRKRGTPEGGDPSMLLTEDGAALVFTQQHKGELLYCHHAGAWYRWSGAHWRKEETRLAFHWCRETARRLAEDAGNPKAAAAAGQARFATGVERFCQADPDFAVTSEVWDRDPWLLGTPGGTVDLRTGELRPPRREDRITRCTAAAPAETADCPAWLRFLEQATGGDAALIAFLQAWFGYTLTGDTSTHALLFVYGPGGNGKGVLLTTVAGILGSYAVTAAMDTFVASLGNRHSTELAMLHGARMVMATETEEGQPWAEARIKALTGGDPITARFMRRDNFTFFPRFKLAISGNHKPVLRNVDDAARRRFNIVPFLNKPARPDTTLPARLRAEWPAILRWMIDGAIAWQQFGLAAPPVVRAATDAYFEEQDVFGAWMAERCILDPQLSVRPSWLLSDFNGWADENGEKHANRNRLRGWIERVSGVRYARIKGADYVKGIGLRSPEGAQGADGGGR